MISEPSFTEGIRNEDEEFIKNWIGYNLKEYLVKLLSA